MIISEAGGKDTSIFQAKEKTKPPFFKNMTKDMIFVKKMQFLWQNRKHQQKSTLLRCLID
ncbi:MAG: hypothetical protein IJT61_01910 [Bacteroidales bacterium]|nr:hypothetical protein [Bacteroidales bacterium]